MKAKQRHQLKQNEFAITAARVATIVREQQGLVIGIAVGVVAVLGIIVGYAAWRNSQENQAGAMLGAASATAGATIAPASSLPGAEQAPGTFPTEAARAEAALEAFRGVAVAYPSSRAAVTAAYRAALQLVELGRLEDAAAAYEQVIATGDELYAPMARMGLAQVRLAGGQPDEAVAILTELSGDLDGPLPVDGVLMELGEASETAGRAADARAAYRRIVDEFADSGYALEAGRRLDATGAPPGP